METGVPAPALAPKYCDSECKLPVPPPFRAGVKASWCQYFMGVPPGVLWAGQGKAGMFLLSLPLSTSYCHPQGTPRFLGLTPRTSNPFLRPPTLRIMQMARLACSLHGGWAALHRTSECKS